MRSLFPFEHAGDNFSNQGTSRIALLRNVKWLPADFNCTVREPAYVNDVLDRLAQDESAIFDQILYIEQPFPYDFEKHVIDVRSANERKPLLMDESAHDWRQVRLGRSLGWGGVALKTCKAQIGAILSLCWAQAHGMALVVQDITNRCSHRFRMCCSQRMPIR